MLVFGIFDAHALPHRSRAISVSLCGGSASAERRMALVAGNSAYQNVTRLDHEYSKEYDERQHAIFK